MNLKGRRQSDNVVDKRGAGDGKARRKNDSEMVQGLIAYDSEHLTDNRPMKDQTKTERDYLPSEVAYDEGIGYVSKSPVDASNFHKFRDTYPTQKLEPPKKKFAETPKKAPTPTARPEVSTQVTPGKWETKSKKL